MDLRLLIKNGYIVDPDTKFEGISDILIKDGIIAEVGTALTSEADRVIDASGLTVMPGLVDLHVHLRDPGQTYKEELGTAVKAAAHGGVTTLLAMPNTRPAMDSVEGITELTDRAKKESPIHVLQSAAITKGLSGDELVDIESICDSGVKAFSEDGKSVMNSVLMLAAMKRIAEKDALICDHCEDIGLVRGGVMNEDSNSERLGLPGIANAVEDVITARDILLAKDAGVRLHLCHCSTEGAAKILKFAKREGLQVTGEVCPHHFILSSDDIPGDDANYKMNPPLRSKTDVEAVIEGLRDGTFDVISTDHAPHGAEEKSQGFRKAPFGIVGIETSAALTYTELVRTGVLTLMQMAEKMSFNPAKILRVPGGSLKVGSPADIVVFDFENSFRIDPETFLSKGRNTPFAGREVYGRTMYTIADGKIVWEERA